MCVCVSGVCIHVCVFELSHVADECHYFTRTLQLFRVLSISG